MTRLVFKTVRFYVQNVLNPDTCEIISNPSEDKKCFVGTLKDCKDTKLPQ